MSNFITLPENTHGRDFVVGDIHGSYPLLANALAQADFNFEKDRLISVGDLIDRGPYSELCLPFLAEPWFHAIRGNHEDIFLDLCRDGKIDKAKLELNVRNGMGWLKEQSPDTLHALEDAFRKLPLAMEVQTARGSVGFVHAEVPKRLDWQTFTELLNRGDAKTIHSALWGRTLIESNDQSGVYGIDRLFCGHSIVESKVRRLGNCYFIDTGAVIRQMHEHEDAFAITMADIRGGTMAMGAPINNGVNMVEQISQGPFGQYVKYRP